MAAQSAIGIVWGAMSYAMHKRRVQETCSAGSWEWQRQKGVQVSRDAIRMQGMRFHEWNGGKPGVYQCVEWDTRRKPRQSKKTLSYGEGKGEANWNKEATRSQRTSQ